MASISGSSNVVNVMESKLCISTHLYDTYKVVTYEQDWTSQKLIELT